MKFLIREIGKKKSAHLWTGDDTMCLMWSRGGLNRRKAWRVTDTPEGLPICTMCENNKRKADAANAGKPQK